MFHDRSQSAGGLKPGLQSRIAQGTRDNGRRVREPFGRQLSGDLRALQLDLRQYRTRHATDPAGRQREHPRINRVCKALTASSRSRRISASLSSTRRANGAPQPLLPGSFCRLLPVIAQKIAVERSGTPHLRNRSEMPLPTGVTTRMKSAKRRQRSYGRESRRCAMQIHPARRVKTS